MRRTHLLAFLLALPALGCASLEKSYRDFAPETPFTLGTAAPSPEADALVARFYGPQSADARTIADALSRAPAHAGLHEIAAYEALVRADKHAAFEHFLAAARDVSAPWPEIYLWELRSLARSTTEHLQLQALLREVKDRHPRPLVRQLAAYDLARELTRLGEHEEATELIATLGFIDAWQVVGAFDNDQGKGLETEYAPEQSPGLEATFAGVRLPVRYRPLAVNKLDGGLPLGDVLWPSTPAVAYAQTFVTTARPRQVDVRLTTTNAVRVWVSGKLVASDDKIFHAELDNVVVRVALEAGANRLLIKSAHETGPFDLAVRISEIDGSRPADLRYAGAPAPGSAPPAPAAEAASGAKAASQLVSPLGALDKLADKNRKRFLEARLWAREGHARRASWYLSPLVAENPDNPAAMLFGAMALLDNGEAGKALDLVNRGVQRFPDALGFLAERARFHAQRKLWDRAERDLATLLQKQPGARDAAMERAISFGARGWTIDRCLELDAIVARWPDDATALTELGRCKVERGYVEEGERALRRARALAPGDARILLHLVEAAVRRLDYPAAHGFLRELGAARPGSPDVMLEEAEVYRREGKVADARASLEAARARNPDAPRAYDKLAQLAHEARDAAGAERWWRLALEREPEDAQIAQRLAALAPTALPLGDRLMPTADDIDRAVRSASTVKVHPGSHVVVLLDDEVLSVNADGSTKRGITHVAQAVTTDGRDTLIQAKLPAGGRTAVIEAYALRKNGERQDASSIQGGIVRFRGLEVGSITVVQYTYFAPPSRFLPNEFAGEWRLQATNAQMESSRWRVVLPKDRALNVETRGPVERSEEVVGDRKVWSFSVKNAPPLVPEPNMTPAADELWMAAVSTLKSWDAYARWEAALLAEALQPGAELDALAHKLTAGAKTSHEKLLRLWAYVAQEIRYQQEYEDSIAGVRPHPAGIVLERGYGDCKDKAVLMMRLARVVGVELRFALLRTTSVGKVKKELPNQQCNHAIVYAPKQPGIDDGFFIDTTTNGLDIGNMRADDEGATSLVLDKDRWEWIPIPYQSPDLELVRHDLKVDLADPQKAVARDRYEARGGVASGVRVALRSGEGAKKYYQGLSDQLFPGTTLLTGGAEHPQDLSHPLSAHLEIDVTNAVKTEDDHLRFELPFLFPLSHAAALATRHHPLRLWRGTQELTIDLDLGDKQKALHLPPDFSVDHACFTVSRAAETKGTHVVVKTRYRNTCAEIAPADYPAFRVAVQKAVAKAQDAVVFGVTKKK